MKSTYKNRAKTRTRRTKEGEERAGIRGNKQKQEAPIPAFCS
jgi:hypothetical protein